MYIEELSLGPCGVILEKVKAHRSTTTINSLQETDRAKARANRAADSRAKAAAEDDALSTRHQTVIEAAHDIKDMLYYMSAFLPGARGTDGWLDAHSPVHTAL